MQATADNSTVSLPESHISRMKAPPPPINTNFPSRPPPVPIKQVKPASSFVTPTDLQHSTAVMGKRPAGTRLVSEPVMANTSQAMVDAQKAKKGLPFLKNPMSSLLMRRKGTQNSPDLNPLPFPQPTEEPSYDPRIRGTRVHDFSAPRPRRIVSNDAGQGSLSPRPDGYSEFEKSPIPAPQREAPSLPTQMSRDGRSASSGSGQRQPYTLDVEAQYERHLNKMPSEQTLQDTRRASFDQKPLPEKPLSPTPEVPPKDDAASSRTVSTKSRVASVDAASVRLGSTASTRTTRSRNISLTETIIRRESVMSSLPKHMKSTSSRFSFDMIGAAKAEKLLEERHRQKALEKQTSDPVSAQRDSRFDDFDDDFDYDAMMDDDGLEERIPGVNADYDEEEDFEVGLDDVEPDLGGEDDPDNDQENFAGFTFQRSNPQSSVTSPHTPGMLITPRDANGNPVGFAVTKNTTPDPLSATSQAFPFDSSDLTLQPKLEDSVAGLGIQGIDMSQPSTNDDVEQQPRQDSAPPHIPRPSARGEDDLYFDEGLLQELALADDEIQPSTFDESIFDNHDTDQYGRPIPGAFAQAQAMRAAHLQDQEKRVSDSTSRLSTQSGANQSTAHTSMSVGLQHFPSVTDKDRDASAVIDHEQPVAPAPSQISSADKVAAYQAALAEAAHKAAASGKFRRDSSPPAPAELTITSPTTGSQPSTADHNNRDPAFDDYDDYDNYNDDDLGNGLDDYDFDDDAIIAEANASALANDSDGFYGQEFGFYSAPAQQSHHAHHGSTSSNSSSLSAQNLYEYSNGGFFGPSGVNRSTSGRVVSREPNLTPITERSEYSNRNSIMSLTLPPAIGSEGRNSGSLQSPGLAQLAMMADDSDMSLSALLRLRNKAWGGSQASLVSSPRDQSPRSDRAGPGERGDGAASPWGIPSAGSYLGVANHGRKNSAFSLWSNSDAGSGSGSPTMTMNMAFPSIPAHSAAPVNIMPSPIFSPPAPPAQQPSPVPQCPPVFEDEEIHDDAPPIENSSMSNSGVWMKSPSETSHTNMISPISPTVASGPSRRPGMGHRHKGSADSISYIKEEDSGETRWVVERRRTAETGEVEILGREVLEGGRI